MPAEWNEVISAIREHKEAGVIKLKATIVRPQKRKYRHLRTFNTQRTWTMYSWTR
jgi:hypothetical protein